VDATFFSKNKKKKNKKEKKKKKKEQKKKKKKKNVYCIIPNSNRCSNGQKIGKPFDSKRRYLAVLIQRGNIEFVGWAKNSNVVFFFLNSLNY